MSGSSSIDVFNRISPASGASRASMAIGCGHTVGYERVWCPIETHAKPIPAAARTTSMASSMMAVGARFVGLQNGVRWKPMRTGVFYPNWCCAPQAVAGLGSRRPRRAYKVRIRHGDP